MNFGEMLVAHKIITPQQLQQAIEHQKKTNEKIFSAVVSLHFITEQQLQDFFSHHLNIPFYDLKLYDLDLATARLLPESYARLYHAIILKKYNEGFLVGMADPLDVVAIDALSQALKKPLSFALVKVPDLTRAFESIYRQIKAISGYAKQLSEELTLDRDLKSEALHSSAEALEAPVVKLLNTLFEDAVQANASDIHIEPNVDGIRIRLRVDGILHEEVVKEPLIMPAIVSRLKLISGLNISEKRLPQDGRFELNVKKQQYSVRLSTMPTLFGESVVMRMLKQSAGILKLESTGMHAEILTRFRRLLHKPNGIILVTGPTGSGKSTTLYASINEVNRPEIQVITVEDPIEYSLPWAVQTQVNEVIGLGFATVLRSILRHDPDVILVGEIRDKETCEIALRAALTGRLVLSTLHTNDSAGAIYRLMDAGVDSFIIAATVQAILAQRLVGKNCDHCVEEHTLTRSESIWLAKFNFDLSKITFKQGKGCSHCAHTGYHGRQGIFELLEMNEQMAIALRHNDQNAFQQAANEALKGKLLIHDAFALVCDGVTSVQEMMRVINEGYN